MTDTDTASPQRTPVVCVAENRPWCEPGIRLLIASLARHSPNLVVELFYPVAGPAFVDWVAGYPKVRLNTATLDEPWRGWNIKPIAILTLFDLGYRDVLWVDTDIIVANDVNKLYGGVVPDAVVVAEEALCSSHYDGDAMRARLWGLQIGRALPFELNGGVVGFPASQVELVHEWQRVLNSDAYLEAQKLPWDERPRHFMADQEVLTALLCDKRFAHIPLKFAYRGRHIIQYFQANCYTVRERLINMRHGMPIFIHSQGHKSWTALAPARSLKEQIFNLYQRVSPYLFEARRYEHALDDRDWLKPKGMADRLLTFIAGGIAPLGGLPIAIVNDLYRHLKWAHTGGEPRR